MVQYVESHFMKEGTKNCQNKQTLFIKRNLH